MIEVHSSVHPSSFPSHTAMSSGAFSPPLTDSNGFPQYPSPSSVSPLGPASSLQHPSMPASALRGAPGSSYDGLASRLASIGVGMGGPTPAPFQAQQLNSPQRGNSPIPSVSSSSIQNASNNNNINPIVHGNSGMSVAPNTTATNNNEDISDSLYLPPIHVQLGTAAIVLQCAAALDEALDRCRAHASIRQGHRETEIGAIRRRFAELKMLSALAADPTAPFIVHGEGWVSANDGAGTLEYNNTINDTLSAIPAASGAPPPPPSEPPQVGSGGDILDAFFADNTTLSTVSNSSRVFNVDAAFPILSSPGLTPQPSAAGEAEVCDSTAAVGISVALPTGSNRSPIQPLPLNMEGEVNAVSDASSLGADGVSSSSQTLAALLSLVGEVSGLATSVARRVGSSLEHTDRVLAVLGAEFRGRDAILAAEAEASGFPLPTSSTALSTPLPMSPNSLSAIQHRLASMLALQNGILLLELAESQGRGGVDREYSTFYAWALGCEPQWRMGVQRAVDERLAREAAVRAAEDRARDDERKRVMALEAIANEKATAEARRQEEVLRLRAEELALAKRLHERREAELAAAAALKARLDQEERQRKDEEYSRLLQTEEELNQQMQLKREAQAAAERREQQAKDEAYALMLQRQEELEDRLAKEEAAIKARVAAAERAQQVERDAQHARLLAAEEEARAAYEAKQQAIAKAKADEEAAIAAKEKERERVRLEMIAAAKAEEDRLRLAQLHRVMTAGQAANNNPQTNLMQQQQQQYGGMAGNGSFNPNWAQQHNAVPSGGHSQQHYAGTSGGGAFGSIGFTEQAMGGVGQPQPTGGYAQQPRQQQQQHGYHQSPAGYQQTPPSNAYASSGYASSTYLQPQEMPQQQQFVANNGYAPIPMQQQYGQHQSGGATVAGYGASPQQGVGGSYAGNSAAPAMSGHIQPPMAHGGRSTYYDPNAQNVYRMGAMQ